MIGVKLTLDFEPSRLERRIGRKKRRVLFRTGAYVRSVVKRGMRSGGKRGKTSNPGEFPRYHGKGLLRRLQVYRVNGEESVVIGALPFDRDSSRIRSKPFVRGRRSATTRRRQTLPELINEGGRARQITEYRSGRRVVSPARYEPRPFTELVRPTAQAFMLNVMEEVEL